MARRGRMRSGDGDREQEDSPESRRIARAEIEEGLTPIRQYEGVQVYVDPEGYFRFRWGGDEEDTEEQHWHQADSVKEAVAAIEKLRLVKEKSRKLDLAVFYGNGKRGRIVGVHGRLLKPILSPKVEEDNRYYNRDGVDSDNLFPVEDWVEDALRQYLQLGKRVKDIGEALKLAQIDDNPRDHNGNRIYSARQLQDIGEVATQYENNHESAGKLAKRLGSLDAAVKEVRRRNKRKDGMD